MFKIKNNPGFSIIINVSIIKLEQKSVVQASPKGQLYTNSQEPESQVNSKLMKAIQAYTPVRYGTDYIS